MKKHHQKVSHPVQVQRTEWNRTSSLRDRNFQPWMLASSKDLWFCLKCPLLLSRVLVIHAWANADHPTNPCLTEDQLLLKGGPWKWQVFYCRMMYYITLPETNIAHENLHLSWHILSKWWIFHGYVSFQECSNSMFHAFSASPGPLDKPWWFRFATPKDLQDGPSSWKTHKSLGSVCFYHRKKRGNNNNQQPTASNQQPTTNNQQQPTTNNRVFKDNL